MVDEPWILRSEMDLCEITAKDIAAIEQQDVDAAYLSKLRLRWNPLGSSDRLTDIGAYCYGERKGTGPNIWVKEKSLIRHVHLPKIIKGALSRIRVERRPLTGVTTGHLAKLLYNDIDSDLSSARAVFVAFVAMLRTFHTKGKYTNSALMQIELAALEILVSGFCVEENDVCAGVRRLNFKDRRPKDKPVLDNESGTTMATAAADHFIQISEAILSNSPLPWRITVAGRPILVTASYYMNKGLPRYLFLDDEGRPPPNCIYDEDYELKKRPLMRDKPGRDPELVREMRNAYALVMGEKKRIRKANDSSDSLTRKRLISEALLSFCLYTYFETGANPATLQGKVVDGNQINAIRFQDICDESGAVSLDIDRGSKCYVLDTFKARAQNKAVNVYFSSTWVKRILPTYRRLRKHISEIGFAPPDNLLFVFASPQHGEFRLETNPAVCSRLRKNPGHILNVFLSECGLERLNVGMIRNFKSVAISRSDGVDTSARILGHDRKTALEKYNRICEAEAQLQIAGLLNNLQRIAIELEESPAGVRLDQGGICQRSEDQGVVEVESDELGVFAPNCRTKTGCWLCPDFAVHADEEDLWKLSSYLHVLGELQQNSEDPHSLRLVHEPITRRLSALIERIAAASGALAEVAAKVRLRIERDQLHPIYEDLRQVYARVNLL